MMPALQQRISTFDGTRGHRNRIFDLHEVALMFDLHVPYVHAIVDLFGPDRCNSGEKQGCQ